MAKGHIRKYIWLIDTIRSANGITYDEINRKWLRSSLNDDGKDWPKRTFFQNINDIWDEFNVEITCDRRDNRYYIEEEISEYGSIRSTLVDALVLNNAVRETPDLNNSIVFSQNFHQKCLPQLVKALKDHTTIRFRYARHDSVPSHGLSLDYDHIVTFQPYGLYHNCLWFTVGRSLATGNIRIYALHRVYDIELTDELFTIPEDFNVKQYMTGFSISDDDIGPERETDDAFTLESFESF